MTRRSLGHAAGDDPNLESLSAFVDRRLPAGERREVIAHLAGCARCREIVAELTRGAGRPGWVRANHTTLAMAASLMLAAGAAGVYWSMRPADRPFAPPAVAAPQAPVVNRPSPEAPAVAPPATAPTRPSQPQSTDDRLRAVAEKSAGGKTFRLVAGEWIDVGYHVSDFLPVATVSTREELAAHPELAPFATLGRRFTVVVGGTVYRVALPPLQP